MKKGFTLIELLAVIVILAIILVIVVPQILGVIKNSTKGAMESDAKIVLNAINQRKALDKNFDPTQYNNNLSGLLSLLGINGENYTSISFLYEESTLLIRVEGKGKYNGFTACGSYHDMKVNEGECSLDFVAPIITLNGSNNIELEQGDTYTELGAVATDNKDGNIAVTVTGTVDINTIGEYTITYTAKDNAGNIATITRIINIVRISYAGPKYVKSKGVNGPILLEGMTPIKWNGSSWVDTDKYDINWYNYTATDKKWANVRTSDGSMWVWIPRYIYNISFRWHTSAVGTIDIKFSMRIDDTRGGTVALDPGSTSNASNNKWTNHPAFTFGNKEVTGIWIAKFQASNNGGNIKITPGVGSWVSQTIGTIFTKVRNMETNSIYGWGTSGIDIDTHLMKNIEWGSVVYLSISTYGKNAEVSTNTSASTGGGSGNAYVSNIGQSTTGNVYGIYDMAGIYYEYTAAYINNGAGLLTSEANSLYTADNKYKDIYGVGSPDSNSGNFPPTINKKGDAIYEICYSVSSNSNAWFSDHSEMPGGTYPFMLRGGYRSLSTSYSGIFAFGYNSSTGNSTNIISFRPIIMIDIGL